jgi:hypothetical protein
MYNLYHAEIIVLFGNSQNTEFLLLYHLQTSLLAELFFFQSKIHVIESYLINLSSALVPQNFLFYWGKLTSHKSTTSIYRLQNIVCLADGTNEHV